MNIGLIDVDGHNFPNLALMKISAWHKAKGDTVEWCLPLSHYDIVYQSKVFDETYSKDITFIPQADRIIKGGTGYGLNNKLPDEIEHIYPDYSLYPELTKDMAYGFITRGCPRGCSFCIVANKEGRSSYKVADLSEFWQGQKFIKLLDPNILACREHIELLEQLVESKAYVDFTQGLDIRLTNDANINLINQIKLKEIHFAWDNAKDDLKPYFEQYKVLAKDRELNAEESKDAAKVAALKSKLTSYIRRKDANEKSTVDEEKIRTVMVDVEDNKINKDTKKTGKR